MPRPVPTLRIWFLSAERAKNLSRCPHATRDSDEGYYKTGCTPGRLLLSADAVSALNRFFDDLSDRDMARALRFVDYVRGDINQGRLGRRARRELIEDIEYFKSILRGGGYEIE